MRLSALALLPLIALGACASVVETYPSRTATEQLLIARAADRAVEGLVLPVPPGSRVFVDGSFFQAENAVYAVSAVRGAVSAAGYALSDRGNADAILEIRSGAMSLEQMRRVVGLPEMRIPINESLQVASLPELSIYSRRDRIGVAEFSGFVYDARTGLALGAISPMIGQYRIRSHKLLMMVTWGQQQAIAGQQNPGDSWRSF